MKKVFVLSCFALIAVTCFCQPVNKKVGGYPIVNNLLPTDTFKVRSFIDTSSANKILKDSVGVFILTTQDKKYYVRSRYKGWLELWVR